MINNVETATLHAYEYEYSLYTYVCLFSIRNLKKIITEKIITFVQYEVNTVYHVIASCHISV